LVLLLIGGCSATLIGLLGNEDGPRQADDSAMTAPGTPSDAAALGQLPEAIELAADEVMGIDVSSHQRDIDWQQVAADGYSFAYVKATEGSNFTDDRFQENWEAGQAEGITPGPYHYFTLYSPGADLAADYLGAVPTDETDLTPAMDLEFDGACDERTEAEHAQSEMDAFPTAVEAAWGRH